MCCGHDSHRSGGHGGHHHGGPCTCGGHTDIEPCFWTTREKIAWLEEYLEDLKVKVKSVEERIVALKGEV
ncbi:MAG: hypothetical protein E3J30_09020 [Anaerolineales bacterium]|nr:MAG: hypothetical protein E3J30_09020 [Anaerolineales bacterium]